MYKNALKLYLSTHFAGEIFGFSVRTATAAEFAVCLYAAFLSCQAVALLHYLVQLPWQMFLVWVLRCGQLVGAHTGQFGILQQQKSVVRRQRGLGLRAGEPVAGQQLRLLVRRVQVIEIVERATAGHGLVQDLRFYHPAPWRQQLLLQARIRFAAQPAVSFARSSWWAAQSSPKTGSPQLRIAHQRLGLEVVAEGL